VQGIGQSKQEFFLGLVVFVEDEVVEPAGCEHRDKRLLDIGARAIDRGIEGVELAVDGFDLTGPRATTCTVTGGIGFSPGTRNSVPALSMSA
jgi:hypothetical protein